MKYRKSGTLLSPGVFEVLYQAIIQEFEQTYKITASSLMDYQLYGYGNYDQNKPNLKNYLLDRTGMSLNGKYLYNKFLEWDKGFSPIKLTREFSFVYFNALGYDNLAHFLEARKIPLAITQRQDQLNDIDNKSEGVLYYVGYYEGEDREIIKTKLTIFRKQQKVKWVLQYWENEELIPYAYWGEIKYQEGGVCYIFDNRKNELDRSLFVGFSYDRRVRSIPYIIGMCCGFDRERNPVSGIVLFERVQTLEKMDALSKEPRLDPIIEQFIKGRRWVLRAGAMHSLDDLKNYNFQDMARFSPRAKPPRKAKFYLQGNYELVLIKNNGVQVVHSLVIDQSGIAICSNDRFTYTGMAFISEGSILSIQIDECNGVSHSAQVLAFVGRYPQNRIEWIKGSWHGLNDGLVPETSLVVIANSIKDLTRQEIDRIHKNEMQIKLKD